MNNGASTIMDDDRSHIATLSRARLRAFSVLLILAFVGFTANWILNSGSTQAIQWNAFLIAFAIGAAAQLVDGALGMAYGVTSNSMLLASGLPPAAATATVHVAEAFTTAASGLSHWKLGNIDQRIFGRLVVPGVVGGVLVAPIAARLTGRLNRRLLMVCVGTLISMLSLWTISRALGL